MVPRLHRTRKVRSVVWLGVATVLGGCPGSSTTSPDSAPDDGGYGEGLTIRIDVDQSLPATTMGGAIRVEDISISTATIRALGDSAPGDITTTRQGLELVWSDSEEPDSFTFERAPAGRYSSVKMHIVQTTSADHAFRIRGTVDFGGLVSPFEIDAEQSDLSSSIPVDEMLSAGGNAEIQIVLTIAALVDPIDWSRATSDDGSLVIQDGNSELAKVEAALLGAAFREE